MIIRRCELCRRQIPKGLRVDARFCSANCRVNAHKQRQREAKKEDMLTPQPPPTPRAVPYTPEWDKTIEFIRRYEPKAGAVGYRVGRYDKKTRVYNWFPNPADTARLVGTALRTQPYYWWEPFEPAAVPEIGMYLLQIVGRDGLYYPPTSEYKTHCVIPIADPQARFHGNRQEKLVAPAVLRQRAALIARANRLRKSPTS